MSYISSAFPPSTDAAKAGLAMYNRIVDAITDMTAVMNGVSDNDGNISLAAAKAIEWDSVSKITWSAAKVQIDTLEVPSPWTYGTLLVTGDAVVSNDVTLIFGGALVLTGNLAVAGIIHVPGIEHSPLTIAQIAEPGDPEDEHSVMWCSNGTGVGDVGDIMLKIQHGSVVKSTTIVDFA